MQVGVVVPCYKVKDSIIGVIQRIGDEVSAIYMVDDCCPDQTADFIEANLTDPRITLVRHNKNTGVGGAVKSGYRLAMADGMDIVVKIDGDGQMDPSLVPNLIRPILRLDAEHGGLPQFSCDTRSATVPWSPACGSACVIRRSIWTGIAVAAVTWSGRQTRRSNRGLAHCAPTRRFGSRICHKDR